MSKLCFVIQPFDRAGFDRRFDDIYNIALTKAGLQPYRVDRDPSSSIPVIDIEAKIRQSAMCFADISADNPNVWLEVGLAIAHGKELCLVCLNGRSKYPFDIQHYSIIGYDNQSRSDFDLLEKSIYDRASAIIGKIESQADIQASLVVHRQHDDIDEFQMSVVSILASQPDMGREGTGVTYIQTDMERFGYNALATNVAIKRLEALGMVSLSSNSDHNGHEYTVIKMQEKGWSWLAEHTSRFSLKIIGNASKKGKYSSVSFDEDIPF